MKINAIIWEEVVIRSNEYREWANCTIDYSSDRGTAWIVTEDFMGNHKSVLMGIDSIQELTPYSFKAKGKIFVGEVAYEATLEAKF